MLVSSYIIQYSVYSMYDFIRNKFKLN